MNEVRQDPAVSAISLQKLLEASSECSGKIYLYGANDIATLIMGLLEDYDLKIAGIYDSYLTDFFCNFELKNKERCCQDLSVNDILIICSTAYREIAKSLLTSGLNKHVKVIQAVDQIIEDRSIFNRENCEKADLDIYISNILDSLPQNTPPSLNKHLTTSRPKIYSITFYGRSGSYLLSSLFDGHSQIAQLDFRIVSALFPMIYYSCSKLSNSLSELDKHILARELIHLFPKRKDSRKFQLFLSHFFAHLSLKAICSISMLELIYIISESYYNAEEIQLDKNCVLVWQKHGQFSENFEQLIDIESWPLTNIVMVRRPIDSLDSHVKSYIGDPLYHNRSKNWITQLLFGSMLKSGIKRKNSVKKFAVRFEDIHKQPEATMKALCKQMGVEFQRCMLETTLKGKPYIFPSSSISPIFGTEPKRAIAKEFHTNKYTFNQYTAIGLRSLLTKEQSLWGYKNAPVRSHRINMLILVFGLILSFLSDCVRHLSFTYKEFIESYRGIIKSTAAHVKKQNKNEYRLVDIVRCKNKKN